MALSPSQVFTLARQAGFSATEATLMTAIAGGESGWNPQAVGDVSLQDSTWGPSIGLWQIRSLKAEQGTGKTRDASRLTDPAFNARSAYAIYKSEGLKAWSVYSSGAYKSYLGQAGKAGMVDVSGLDLPNPVSAVTDALPNPSEAVATAMDGLWKQVAPFAVKGTVAGAGLALLVVGGAIAAWPTTTRIVNAAPGIDLTEK